MLMAMNGYEIIFKSGVTRIVYAKTIADTNVNPDEVSYIINVADNLANEKEFRQANANLIRSISVLQEIQSLEIKKQAYEQAQEKGLIPKQPGSSGLTLLK